MMHYYPGVGIDYFEHTYTEAEMRALFKAIYEGKIKRIILYDLNKNMDIDHIAYDISPIVRCKNCRFYKGEGICKRPDISFKEVSDEWFCAGGKERIGGNTYG